MAHHDPTAGSTPPTEKERQIAQNSIAMEANPQEGLRLFVQAMFGANNFLYSY